MESTPCDSRPSLAGLVKFNFQNFHLCARVWVQFSCFCRRTWSSPTLGSYCGRSSSAHSGIGNQFIIFFVFRNTGCGRGKGRDSASQVVVDSGQKIEEELGGSRERNRYGLPPTACSEPGVVGINRKGQTRQTDSGTILGEKAPSRSWMSWRR